MVAILVIGRAAPETVTFRKAKIGTFPRDFDRGKDALWG